MVSVDYCAWLGTAKDSEICHAAPSEEHLCYARKHPAGIDLEYQGQVCFAKEHKTCEHYRVPQPPAPPTPPPLDEYEEEAPPRRRFRLLLVILWIVAFAAAAAALYFYWPLLRDRVMPATATSAPVAATASPTATASPSEAVPTPTASPALVFVELTGTPTPVPGGAIKVLVPEASGAGWVSSDDDRSNHLGDSYLYAGVFDGVIYHGMLQFDLSSVPRGAALHAAVLELSGLDDRRLGSAGTWEARLLDGKALADWHLLTYQEVHNAPVLWSLSPALSLADLAEGSTNVFRLSPEMLAGLQQALLEGRYTVELRIDGPLAGENSVFAWDTGSGSATRGHRPRLLLSVGPAPETPLPTGTPQVVVVTSTPAPANVMTAAARVLTATAAAADTGTATPTSIYEWTATPVIVVTSTPTPADEATEEYRRALATAVALTTGTYTPTPVNLVTATPTPWMIPAEQIPPMPVPPATATPALPGVLRGRILYQCNRLGKADVWVVQPDGSEVGLLAAAWPYAIAAARESYSADGANQAYVGTWRGDAALKAHVTAGEPGRILVVFRDGSISSPVWSPTARQVAFVGDSGGGTQLWLIGADGKGRRELTAEGWGTVSHPSFSPDGSSLVFARLEADGTRRLWAVDVTGRNLRQVSTGPYDEWDPVWVK